MSVYMLKVEKILFSTFSAFIQFQYITKTRLYIKYLTPTVIEKLGLTGAYIFLYIYFVKL